MTDSPTPPNVGPLLLSLRAAAKALSLCERTVWGLAKRGEIASVRCGRRRLFDPRDLRAWLDSKKVNGTGDHE